MTWEQWHWFWAKVFGRRVPTSGDRAHIGRLLLCYRPEHETPFDNEHFLSDARHVHRIGDLYVFDYGDTPVETLHMQYARPPHDIGSDDLLKENERMYRRPPT